MKTIVTLSLIIMSFSLSAAPQWCEGTITSLYQDVNGGVVINGTWRGDHTQICNVNSEWNGVSTEVCKSWLSILIAANLSKEDVLVKYADLDSCATVPKYGDSPSPLYVMLK